LIAKTAKEADEDIRHGRVLKARNVEDLIEKLDSITYPYHLNKDKI
jgi:hypothetical protein